MSVCVCEVVVYEQGEKNAISVPLPDRPEHNIKPLPFTSSHIYFYPKKKKGFKKKKICCSTISLFDKILNFVSMFPMGICYHYPPPTTPTHHPPPPIPLSTQHKRFLKESRLNLATEENKRHTLLLLVLTYYFVFGTLAIIQQSLELGQSHDLKAAVADTFRCEAFGSGSNCTLSYDQFTYPKFSSLVYILLGLIPGVHMIFVLPASQIWKYCTRVRVRDDAVTLIKRRPKRLKSSTDF